jgi:Immunity protein 35
MELLFLIVEVFVIDYSDAKRIAGEFLQKVRSNVDSANFVIIEHLTREEPFGWVFGWNDKRYIESGNDIYAMSGNQPIVVLRENGLVQFLPSVPWKKDVSARIKALSESLKTPKSS